VSRDCARKAVEASCHRPRAPCERRLLPRGALARLLPSCASLAPLALDAALRLRSKTWHDDTQRLCPNSSGGCHPGRWCRYCVPVTTFFALLAASLRPTSARRFLSACSCVWLLPLHGRCLGQYYRLAASTVAPARTASRQPRRQVYLSDSRMHRVLFSICLLQTPARASRSEAGLLRKVFPHSEYAGRHANTVRSLDETRPLPRCAAGSSFEAVATRRWPNTPRRRSRALEQLALRCKRRQYRPTTYGGRWRRNFPEICPGARCRPP
jgi:hypothetical protein